MFPDPLHEGSGSLKQLGCSLSKWPLDRAAPHQDLDPRSPTCSTPPEVHPGQQLQHSQVEQSRHPGKAPTLNVGNPRPDSRRQPAGVRPDESRRREGPPQDEEGPYVVIDYTPPHQKFTQGSSCNTQQGSQDVP